MKFLVIGDPHFKIDNTQEVDIFIERVVKLTETRSVDYIIILGDVLHTHERLHTIPMNKALSFIDKMRSIAFTYVLVGNHDMISHNQFLTTNHWMNGMKEWSNVKIVDTVVQLKNGEYLFFFCPFVPNGRFEEALNTNGDEWKHANCIFAHQEFYGCKMGAIVSEDGDRWDLNFPLIISGHIHSSQWPQKNIFYTGSAMQNAFGESEKNIVCIVTFENSKYTIDEIDLGLSRKKILYVDIDNIDTFSVDEKKYDKVKVSISGEYEDFKTFKQTTKYKEMIDSGLKVVYKPKKKDIDLQIKTISDENIDFNSILLSLVLEEKDSHLYSTHALLVNKKEIDPNSILLI